MAVRQQLQELMRDSQLGGAIVMERQPSPPSSLQPASPQPASPQPASLESLPLRQGLVLEPCATFQCRGCWAVLSDSLQLCAHEEGQLGLLVCYRVTKDVIWEDSLTIGLEGPLLGCAYNRLTCQSCGLVVGFILYSASRELAYLRGFFSFFKDSILCYILKSQMIVEASNMIFPSETLRERLQKLKEKLVESHTRVESLVKTLKELEEKNSGQEGRALQEMQLDDSQNVE
ncbi:protein Mis18-beta [Neopsephotus bourkii]|uniref:protein Mis18-beta n=1 Tax=Neopsephotus bourkii TaxID=309878 RepID=UPI002AA519E6|nr:protein Mis18-beta [Neopsephotus bourkii]